MTDSISTGSNGARADEAALVAAVARGDRAAFAALYQRHASVLLGVAIKIVGERREAEDLLHDVFLEAWRAAGEYDPKRANVRTWLALRMRSRAIDVVRSARVSRNAGDAGINEVLDEHTHSPDHLRARRAVETLSGNERVVLELAYFGGQSCSEIAKKLAMPIGTVKSRLADGMRRLRQLLVARPVAPQPA